jgi:general secretion pathway protein D
MISALRNPQRAAFGAALLAALAGAPAFDGSSAAAQDASGLEKGRNATTAPRQARRSAAGAEATRRGVGLQLAQNSGAAAAGQDSGAAPAEKAPAEKAEKTAPPRPNGTSGGRVRSGGQLPGRIAAPGKSDEAGGAAGAAKAAERAANADADADAANAAPGQERSGDSSAQQPNAPPPAGAAPVPAQAAPPAPAPAGAAQAGAAQAQPGAAQAGAGAARPAGGAQAVPGVPPGAGAVREVITAEPGYKGRPVTILEGKIPLRDFLKFFSNFSGLPILIEADPQFLSKEIEIVATLRNVNGEVLKALLETNKIRVFNEKLPPDPNDPERKETEVLKVENMQPTQPVGRDPKPIVIVQVSEIEEIKDRLDPDQYATLVFTLLHVTPRDAIDALSDLVSGTVSATGAAPGGAAVGRRSANFSMVEVKNTDMLIITAKFGLVNYLQQLLKLIDVPIRQPDRLVKIIQVEWADASELATTMNEFIQGRAGRFGRFGVAGQRSLSTRTPTPAGASGSPTGTAASGAATDFSTKLIPDMRTNKIILETYDEQDLQDIEMLLAELDVRYENRRLRTNIYQVRYLKAIEVAQDLQLLIQGASGSVGGLSGTRRGTTRTTSGLGSRRGAGTTGVPRLGQPGLTPGAGPGTGTGAPQNVEMPSLIVPHEPTNSLLIQAEPEEYDEILNILSKIDSKRRQVFLEAALVQVQSGSSLNYIIELLAGNPDDEATRLLAASSFGLTGIDIETFNRVIPDLSTPGTVTGGLAAIMHNGKFPFLIQFFKNNTDSQILATPFILADDNEENRIDILETRFVTNTSVQNNQTTLQQQTGEPAGITLAITPTISGSQRAVFLTMEMTVSAFQGQGTANTLPPKAENTMTSSVTIPDGEIFVVGGLTRENKSKTVDKVPILGDIPLLGKLFRSESTDQSQNNLYVFLRAHVLTDEEFRDGLDLTGQAEEKLRAVDPSLQTMHFNRPKVTPSRARSPFDEDDERVIRLNQEGYETPSSYRGGNGRNGARGARPPANGGAGAAPHEDAEPAPVVPLETPPAAGEGGPADVTSPPDGAPEAPAPAEIPLAPKKKLRGWFE